jgi:hypothetical protein
MEEVTLKKLILFFTLGILSPLSAQAESTGAIVDIDVHASTLGLGAGFAYPISENTAARLNLNKYTYTNQTTSDNVKYDASVKLESIGLLADWHLFSGVTHLTGGVIYNNNEISMTATPVGSTYTFNGVAYTSSTVGTATATVTFDKVAPYLGFGWSGRASKTGFSFKSDIGVMFQGSPKAKLTATGAAGNSALAADLAAAEKKMNTDLESFKIWPVISVGLGYAF